MSDDQWFMAIGGHQVGPVSRDDVVTNLRNGTIDGNTLVFTEGMKNWTPLKDVPPLASYLSIPVTAPGGEVPSDAPGIPRAGWIEFLLRNAPRGHRWPVSSATSCGRSVGSSTI